MKGFMNKLQNNINQNIKGKKNRGGGQSLGGTKPGTIIRISIPLPGSIGAGVENTKDGTAIISNIPVGTGSQAEAAGLMRGDIVCFPDTNGRDEMPFRLFLDMAKSDARPLVFDVRRFEAPKGSSASSTINNNPRTGGNGKKMRADDEARRAAVIAAAEARDKQNKQKKKPIRKGAEVSAADKKKIEEQREKLAIKNETYMAKVPLSEEARRAVLAAKVDEAQYAQQLGYNPYVPVKGTGQQASTTVTAVKHGSMNAGENAGTVTSTGTGKTIVDGKIIKSGSNSGSPSRPAPQGPINPLFDDAFALLVTTNQSSEEVEKSLRIMRKLIQNATSDIADEAKKKVRISNANKHIQAAVNDTNGALDIMFAVGFMMVEDELDKETYLVYPPGDVPAWVQSALNRMEHYESGLWV